MAVIHSNQGDLNIIKMAPCLFILSALILSPGLYAQATIGVIADDPDARPPVAGIDVKIVQRAAAILNSPSKWNRSDNRICPKEARTFSIYCALERATDELSGKFEHRGAAMQEARFVIEQVAPDWEKYDHRLMDYNNDPKTTFADVQRVFRLLEQRVSKRLKDERKAAKR